MKVCSLRHFSRAATASSRLFGQGGMGKVYRAQDLELNERAVAIKEMIVSGLRAWEVIEATEAFKREATLLAALQHPNLPTVFEHFEENGRWYMVMSFIPGETLEEYLKRTNRTRLPLNEVLDIGQQLCTVLSYLHSQQPPLIFRDVKPANIMRARWTHLSDRFWRGTPLQAWPETR